MYYTVDLKFKFFPIFLYRAILLKEINIVKKIATTIQPSCKSIVWNIFVQTRK